MREFVATEFDALLHDGRPPAAAATATAAAAAATPQLPVDSEAFIERLPPELAAARARRGANSRACRPARRQQAAAGAAAAARRRRGVADGAARWMPRLRFIDWVEPLLRRESYLALLVERPEVQNRLLRLLGLARWPMRYLMRHPGVIDELADERLLHGRFERESFIADLDARHAAWERSGEADEESLLDTLRRAHHAEVFRTLVRDVEGHSRVEQVADDLSALADAVHRLTLRWAWLHLKQRHRDAPRLAVIAYGKLGGKELGYGSDLDVVFVCRRQRRARRRQGGRGVRRVRAQADHLADAAHRGRRAVRHRHRAAARTATRGCW